MSRRRGAGPREVLRLADSAVVAGLVLRTREFIGQASRVGCCERTRSRRIERRLKLRSELTAFQLVASFDALSCSRPPRQLSPSTRPRD